MSEKYVLDTSALLQGFITDQYSDNIQSLLAKLTKDDPPELHVLDIGLAESGNVLWKRVRFSNVPAEQAFKLLDGLLDLPLIVHESRELLRSALTIGLSRNLAIYDCLYIALAAELDLPLITADVKQQEAAIASSVKIKPITDLT
jgi:predicted nucleic acid-binding protein